MTKTAAQLEREVLDFIHDPEQARIVANDADIERRHDVARKIRGKAGLTISQEDIPLVASTDPAEWARIFDRLEPGQLVYLSMIAVMGMNRAESGAYVAHKVGRRSKPKRPQWWTEAISLLPADGSKAHPFARYKLWKNKSGAITASAGDMGVSIKGMYAP